MKNFFLQKILLLLVLLTFSRCEIDFDQGYTFVYSPPASEPVTWAELVSDKIMVSDVSSFVFRFSSDGLELYINNTTYLLSESENDVDSATYYSQDKYDLDRYHSVIKFSNVTSEGGYFYYNVYYADDTVAYTLSENFLFYLKL